MISTRLHRIVDILTRLVTGLISAASLTFFVLILYKVYDPNFVPVQPGYSVLPIAALSYTILWNFIVLITIFLLNIPQIVYLVGDLLAFIVIVVPTAIGFAHDDAQYLSNGYYQLYDNETWLKQAIIAGSLALSAAVLQLSLLLWAFVTPRTQNGSVVPPPPYLESEYGGEKKEKDEKDEKDVEGDWKSVSSYEAELHTAKGHGSAI